MLDIIYHQFREHFYKSSFTCPFYKQLNTSVQVKIKLMLESTRMHSSRMRTACSSSRQGGVSIPPWSRHPPAADTPSWSRHPPAAGTLPLEQTPPKQTPPRAGTPWPDLRQLPPWVWAWTRSPSTSPLGMGLDQIPLNFPLGCGPGETCYKACWDTTCNACWDSTPL